MPSGSEVSAEASRLSRSSTRRPRSSIVRMSGSKLAQALPRHRLVLHQIAVGSGTWVAWGIEPVGSTERARGASVALRPVLVGPLTRWVRVAFVNAQVLLNLTAQLRGHHHTRLAMCREPLARTRHQALGMRRLHLPIECVVSRYLGALSSL
eukprot:1170888-Prymnesium_polylepis.1